jgi:hypothetical protein
MTWKNILDVCCINYGNNKIGTYLTLLGAQHCSEDLDLAEELAYQVYTGLHSDTGPKPLLSLTFPLPLPCN